MADGITSGAILKRTMELTRGNLALVLGALGGLTALAVAMDMLIGFDGTGNMAVTGVANVVAQYFVTRKVMEDRGLLSLGTVGFGGVLGLCLLSGFGIGFGLLLLVVPGVILAIRWFPAVPALLDNEAGVIDALRESWDKTRNHSGAILGVMIIIYLPVIAAASLIGFLSEGMVDPTDTFGISLLVNAMATAALVAGWHAAVAFWELRAPAASALAEVFA